MLIDVSHAQDNTPLHLASLNGHRDAVLTLLNRGASTDVQTGVSTHLLLDRVKDNGDL